MRVSAPTTATVVLYRQPPLTGRALRVPGEGVPSEPRRVTGLRIKRGVEWWRLHGLCPRQGGQPLLALLNKQRYVDAYMTG
jgi:hypothetical protein